MVRSASAPLRRLRSRLEADPANPQLLLTARGRGYKLVTRQSPGQ